MSATAVRYEVASGEHAPLLGALFGSAGSGCFCNYWHFEGDKHAWLERCFVHPAQNRAALEERLSGSELSGIIALERAREPTSEGDERAPVVPIRESRAIGWMKLERAERLPRLYAQRLYRGLPCFQSDRSGVFTVGCFFVDEERRGQGVARGLLRRGIEVVRALHASAVEALPRASPADAEALRPDELPRGPVELFRELGFTPVSDFEPYPVMRLALR